MPELPEVERVRLTLCEKVLGQKVISVVFGRHQVVRGSRSPKSMGVGSRIVNIVRTGKELALMTEPVSGTRARNNQDGRVIAVHLGMTGSLRYHRMNNVHKLREDPHVHVMWKLKDGIVAFRDPRRFGGIWTFDSPQAMHEARLAHLGEDALRVTATQLQSRLARTRRPIKAALMDQRVIAGLGNIYVDELLFASRVHPLTPACGVSGKKVAQMVTAMHELLERAISSGGSSLRDYVDGQGRKGAFQMSHQVYGRGGEPCLRCGKRLQQIQLGGRTTVYCGRCQRKVLITTSNRRFIT